MPPQFKNRRHKCLASRIKFPIYAKLQNILRVLAGLINEWWFQRSFATSEGCFLTQLRVSGGLSLAFRQEKPDLSPVRGSCGSSGLLSGSPARFCRFAASPVGRKGDCVTVRFCSAVHICGPSSRSRKKTLPPSSKEKSPHLLHFCPLLQKIWTANVLRSKT